MAQLHRRVPRLPHRQRLSRPSERPGAALGRAAIVLAIVVGGLPALAQREEALADGDRRLQRLEGLAGQLGSEDARARENAAHALGHLDASMLPAIRARIARLRRRRPEQAWAFDVFNRIRRAAGSTRADDEVDIEGGILPVLAQDRHPRVLAMAEPLLLLRSCERLRTFDAVTTMLPIFALDEGGVWRWESRRVGARLGADAMAAALVAQRHEDAEVRSWARLMVERLGAVEPGRAIQGLTDAQLADVLRAYATLRVQSAMRIIVAFVGSERRIVRRAARSAIEQYGSGAIWILRTAYHERAGEQAPREWGWQRVAEEPSRRADDERATPVRSAHAAARAAAERGDLASLERQLDEALARSAEIDDPFPADGYARVADWHFAEGRLDAARRAWSRALRIAPAHPSATAWRARSELADAEEHLAGGVLDVRAYERVLALEPGNVRAAAAVEAARPPGSASSRNAIWIAGGLLLLLSLVLAWPRRPKGVGDVEETPTDAPEDTLPEDTLPEATAETTLA